MPVKRIGKQTYRMDSQPTITGWAAVGGKKEGDGPIGTEFDYISDDAYFGESTWEKAESIMQSKAYSIACDKAGVTSSSLDMIFAGDLLSQCTASIMAQRESKVPYFGLYGACSTMAESLILAAMCVEGGFADNAAAVTSSHFCSAERQFRMPLEYGGQRCPNSQWTATAAGAAIVSGTAKSGPKITYVTPGIIRDTKLKDATNMGAVMALAAFDTLKTHFDDVGGPERYDLIVTGDLAFIGHTIVSDFFKRDGIELTNYNDCGLMLYSREKQEVDAGGSGCGCSASVLCSYILNEMSEKRLNKVLFAGTGALMSAISSGQGESIPGICHAVAIEN